MKLRRHIEFRMKGDETMALQKGERYRCPDANCGCEIEMTKVQGG